MVSSKFIAIAFAASTSAVALPKSVFYFPKPQPIQFATFTDTVRCLHIHLVTSELTSSFQFDNITQNPLVDTQTSAGYQNNINYSESDVGNNESPLSPIKPASEPNTAAVAVQEDLLSGDLTLTPQHTAFKNDAIRYFDLIQLFFGCAVNDLTTVASEATGCGIGVSGYNTAGQMVGIASFNYADDELMEASMARAILPASFVGLVNFTVALATSAAVVADTVILIDNVTHVNYW